jgi:putative restriction endonuclease
MNNISDIKYRTAAFSWLHEQVAIHGDVLPWELLKQGFKFDGKRITLVGPQGIWKPAVFPEIPLSIMTKIDGPYNDSFDPGGLLLYRYQGTNPDQWDNAGLRRAMKEQVPLIYFYNIVKGYYLAIFPVYIVGDNPRDLAFTVAADGEQFMKVGATADTSMSVGEGADARRMYITSTVKVRLHQRTFRERVIDAYREQCALCRIKHRELLDAAHIIPDSDLLGEPHVTNGLSLCKIHHAAFDANILGIRPDYTVEIRSDILKEEDGPMLKHGLQGLHNSKIIAPREHTLRPDPARLEQRYNAFKRAG